MTGLRVGVGVFASALPAWCRCGQLIPAGTSRPWLGPGRPLCERCAIRLGLGDVEGLVDSFDQLSEMFPGTVALARMRHAAAEHAADRCAAVAEQLDAEAAPDDDDGP